MVCFLSQPREIIFGAADEVLRELKRDDITEKKKKVEVEGLLGSMDEERYTLLVGLGKRITDYVMDKHQGGTAEGELCLLVQIHLSTLLMAMILFQCGDYANCLQNMLMTLPMVVGRNN